MKTLYLDCNMGAAGDMLTAALLELHPHPENFIKRFNKLNIPKVKIDAKKSTKCGIIGTQMNVFVNGAEENENMHAHSDIHRHTGIFEIEHIIKNLDISNRIVDNAISVYRLLAEAEGYAHGCDMEDIHFHEVGTMDAVADIVGFCMLIDEIAPDKIMASPVCVGFGQVKCAHGILPVPAPATAYILQGVPIYGGNIKGELCTPTGAVLLKYFVSEFKTMPVMKIEKTGYGMGKKDFETANCVRAILGETEFGIGTVSELCCNIDDMTGEDIGFAVNRLLEEGALDVYTTPIYMKKNRPAVMLNCMCKDTDKEKMLKLIFKHTSTIGVREHISNRYILNKKQITLNTSLGIIRAKESAGFGVKKLKAEYEDIANAARENNISLDEAKNVIYKHVKGD